MFAGSLTSGSPRHPARDHHRDRYRNEADQQHLVSRETVERSIDNSLCFGAYEGEEQIGFARVVTDAATFASEAMALDAAGLAESGPTVIDGAIFFESLKGRQEVV